MYADDSTIYVSAITANEVNETLNKEFWNGWQVINWNGTSLKLRALYLVQIIP
jgi:hypothetical protein